MNGGLAACRSPLLRMPPFPGAKPVGRPVLRKTRDFSPPNSQVIDIDAVAGQIAKARVGGHFWKRARPLPPEAGPIEWGANAGDPWPTIEAKRPIIAPIGNEIALLATAGGCPVLSPGDLRPYSRDDLLAALFHRIAAFDYFDPWNGQPISISAWIDILGDWRRAIDHNREIGVAVGITDWKRGAIGSFLWSGRPVRFARSTNPAKIESGGKAIAAWPSRVPPALAAHAARKKVPFARIEDGFVRSIGLGTHLHPPCSVVIDLDGIYYDPHRPSALEKLLSETEFDDRQLQRARLLIAALAAHGITKYAAGSFDPLRLPQAERRILVPGQVEDDLSVRLGGGEVAGNLDLLRRVREAEPDAWIAYKPHPDVAAGLRRGHVLHCDAREYADTVLPNGSMAHLLDQVDAVHVLTSLTGFEALLRGREVIAHGQPFYAGWGLTRDLGPPLPRRQRRLTVEQLAAAALILYPRYLDPATNLPCPPEILVGRHSERPVGSRGLWAQRKGPLSSMRLLGRLRQMQGGVTTLGRSLAERWS